MASLDIRSAFGYLLPIGVLALLLSQWPVRTAAQAGAEPLRQSFDGIWQTTGGRLPTNPAIRVADTAGLGTVVRLDVAALAGFLSRAPLEGDQTGSDAGVVAALPLPDGSFGRFRIVESPILAPELAAAFPEIRTYRGQGLDDRSATMRLDWTQNGLHAAVIASGGTVYIDPLTPGDLETYISYDPAAAQRPETGFICLVGGGGASVSPSPNALPIAHGATRRTYRLALAVTGEYTAQAGGTKPAALARMTTTMNRVSGVFDRDLSVHFTISTGTSLDPTALIYTNASTDPYTNVDASITAAENQSNLDAVVGNANYDLGHVFVVGNNLGGAASFYVCASATKGRAASGNSVGTGDYFDVNTVVHEMGHQFGANHTFNGTSGNCGAYRVAAHAFEPGGGSTPMGYNFVCGEESPQVYASDYFHVESLNEMTSFLTSGGGQLCGIASAGNTVPTVNAPGNVVIPQGTPFTLTASGSDADGDALTYTWEQYNLGAASSSAATASTDDGTRPLFRSYPPTTSPSRMFPSLQYILNNANVPPQTYSCLGTTCLIGEVLPSTNRTMTFQVTARDNRSGGGAIATASNQVTVTTAAGPFLVTALNAPVSLTGNTVQTVTWNVAGTNVAPVNAANVKISLSTDSGITFPSVLAVSAPNTGTASVLVPNTPTTSARVKVEAVGNIFFDISNANFTITPGSPASLTSVTPNTGRQRRLATVVIAGQQTHFVQGQTSASFGAGITVNDTTVVDATHAIVSLTIGGAALGPRTVILTTGTEAAALVSAFTVTPGVQTTGDFNGDGSSDIAVFRPSTGAWYVRGVSTTTWGGGADTPVAGDYDGDGKTDVAVYRPSTGSWFVLRSSTATGSVTTWGGGADIPVPGDYDGDGKTDIAVFRPSTGVWFTLLSATSSGSVTSWGGGADIPVARDYDGDGKTDVAVFRPSTSAWYILESSTASGRVATWGGGADIPVAADYDGDGKADVAVFRPSSGAWFILRSSTASGSVTIWGGGGDVPVPGDYDADGKADIAVFRPSTGDWFLINSSTGSGAVVTWGGGGDIPVLKRP